MTENHQSLAPSPQDAARHVFAIAGQLAPVTGKAITPESFRQELEAVRRGYSRNTRRLTGAWGVNVYLLELWPRDPERLGGDPLLITTDALPSETRRAEWLAQFSFSYDPARYAVPAPERLRGKARFRAWLQTFRTEACRPVPYRRCHHGGWTCSDQQHPDEIEGDDTPPQDAAA